MTELYDACFHWANKRKRSFPNWELRELHHEAFVAACDIIHKWDPDHRPLAVFLKYHLYDYVHRKYCRLHDVKVVRGRRREDGSWPARKYIILRTPLSDEQMHELPSPAAYEPVDESMPERDEFSQRDREVMGLIGRGLSKTHSSIAMGLTQGRISQLLKRIRGVI